MDNIHYIEKRITKKCVMFLSLGLLCAIAVFLILTSPGFVKSFSFIKLFPAIACVLLEILFFNLMTRELSAEKKRICEFIKDTSTFTHKFDPPLTSAVIINRLKEMGFDISEFETGNYHCTKQIENEYKCNVFVFNPDIYSGEASERALAIFVEKTLESWLNPYPKEFHICLDFRNTERNAQRMAALSRGLMINDRRAFYCFSTEYDTGADILYYADGITRVKWRKQSVIPIYITSITSKLFKVNDVSCQAKL